MSWKHRSTIIKCLELVLVHDRNPYLVSGQQSTTRWQSIAAEMVKMGYPAASHRSCKDKIDELKKAQRDNQLNAVRTSGTQEEYTKIEAQLESLLNVIHIVLINIVSYVF